MIHLNCSEISHECKQSGCVFHDEWMKRSTCMLETLENVELSIVGYDDKNYQHRMKISNDPHGNVTFESGMCLDLLLALQFSLKFRYKALQGETWYREYENGTLGGMSGQVINGEADLAIAQASMVMMMQPLDRMAYLLPTSYQQLTALFVQPRVMKDVLTTVFNFESKLLLLLMWLVLATSFWILQFVMSRQGLSLKNDLEPPKVVGEVIFWCITAQALQGMNLKRWDTPTRILIAVSFFFSVVINLFFSASLTSQLATESIPIKDIQSLEKSDYKIYADKRLPVVHDIVRNIYMRRTRKELSNEQLRDKHIRYRESIPIIQAENAAFISFADAAKNVLQATGYNSNFFCNKLSSLPISQGRLPAAMFVKKNSPIRELLNRKIITLGERGLLHRMNRIYGQNALIQCPIVTEKYRGGLKFTDILSAYLIGTCGSAFSILFLVIELTYERVNNSKKHSK